jgi:MFS family permease
MVHLFGMHSPHVSSSFLEESVHGELSFHTNPFDIFKGDEKEQKPDASQRINKSSANNEKANDEPLLLAKKSHHVIVSFVVIYTMIFFNGCCFTAVMPSVPFYLQYLMAPPAFLGWVVSFYSLGQILGSPVAGWLLSNDFLSSKRLLTITSTLGLSSSALYAVAPGYVFILFSRLLTGISAGMEFTTELTFIANNTTFKERTAYLATVTACNVVGFIMGPALGNFLAILDLHFLGLSIDQYTGPGWLLAAMFLLDLFMVRTFFNDNALEYDNRTNGAEPSSERAGLLGKEQPDTSYWGVDMQQKEEVCESANVSARGDMHEAKDDGVPNEPPPSLPIVLSLIFVQFSLMCGWSLVETITSPLVQDEFAWNVRDCNLLFTCGGFVSLAIYVVFVVASKRVQDRRLVITALTLCSAGFLLAIDWHQLDWVPKRVSALQPPYLVSFLAGFLLLNAGFMTGRSVVFALYSKLIAQQYQGKYLGWMVAAGSAARTLGPFAAVSVYYGIKVAGNNLLALFGSVGSFHLVCLLLVLCQWPQLLPSTPELMPLP